MMSSKCFISQRQIFFASIPENYSKKKMNQEATFNIFIRKNVKKNSTSPHSDLQVPQYKKYISEAVFLCTPGWSVKLFLFCQNADHF